MSPGFAFGLLLSPVSVVGRLPWLALSFTTTVTLKVPFQSAAVTPALVGRFTVRLARRLLICESVPVSVKLVVLTPPASTVPPVPPIVLKVKPPGRVTVTVRLALSASGSATVMAGRSTVVEPSLTDLSVTVMVAGSLTSLGKTLRHAVLTFWLRPEGSAP